MQNSGFIMLPRNFMYWRWYKNANTMRVFLHLVMSANYTEHDFEGMTVRRGQVVTSHPLLSAKLKLSEQQIRTALEHLKSTGEITVRITSKFSIITINSFDSFQPVTDRSTGGQQPFNRPVTDKQQQYNKKKKKKRNLSLSALHPREQTEGVSKPQRAKESTGSEDIRSDSARRMNSEADLWESSRKLIEGGEL